MLITSVEFNLISLLITVGLPIWQTFLIVKNFRTFIVGTFQYIFSILKILFLVYYFSITFQLYSKFVFMDHMPVTFTCLLNQTRQVLQNLSHKITKFLNSNIDFFVVVKIKFKTTIQPIFNQHCLKTVRSNKPEKQNKNKVF